jgi:hypothetical protein
MNIFLENMRHAAENGFPVKAFADM